jgi:hypothetical protein
MFPKRALKTFEKPYKWVEEMDKKAAAGYCILDEKLQPTGRNNLVQEAYERKNPIKPRLRFQCNVALHHF